MTCLWITFHQLSTDGPSSRSHGCVLAWNPSCAVAHSRCLLSWQWPERLCMAVHTDQGTPGADSQHTRAVHTDQGTPGAVTHGRTVCVLLWARLLTHNLLCETYCTRSRKCTLPRTTVVVWETSPPKHEALPDHLLADPLFGCVFRSNLRVTIPATISGSLNCWRFMCGESWEPRRGLAACTSVVRCRIIFVILLYILSL